jgi:hypothetical protein
VSVPQALRPYLGGVDLLKPGRSALDGASG